MLEYKSDVPFETQRKTEPLRVKSDKALETFSDSKFHKVVNSLNRSHAILLNIQKGNKKTKPIHYEQARNELLHLSDKVPIKDGYGVEYSKLSELPSTVYEYCRKLYRFPENRESDQPPSSKKQKAERTGSPQKKEVQDKIEVDSGATQATHLEVPSLQHIAEEVEEVVHDSVIAFYLNQILLSLI